MASKAKVIIPPKHKYKSTKPVPDLDAEDQPYVVPQAEPVTNDADHPDGDGGVVCTAVLASDFLSMVVHLACAILIPFPILRLQS